MGVEGAQSSAMPSPPAASKPSFRGGRAAETDALVPAEPGLEHAADAVAHVFAEVSLGRATGHAEGVAEGLRSGYTKGYDDALGEPLEPRTTAEYARGRAHGRAESQAEAHAQGVAEGREAAHAQGLSEGMKQGYTKGFAKGLVQGRVQALNCRGTALRLRVFGKSGPRLSVAPRVLASLDEEYRSQRDVALLTAEYVIGSEGPLGSRQELEATAPHAIYAGSIDWERTVVVAVSHPEREGPVSDGDLHVLRTVLARFVSCQNTMYDEDPEYEDIKTKQVVVFVRHSSLYQNLDPRQREWTTVEERDAHDTRTPAQIESYRRGLHTLALWFLHPSTYTFLFGAPDDNPRFVWSFWERRVAELISPQHACVDLALFRSEVKYDQRNWLSIFGSSVVELCGSKRRPPLTPEQFNAELQRFDCSDRRDRQLASQLYREAFAVSICGARQLTWTGLRFGFDFDFMMGTILYATDTLRELTLTNCGLTGPIPIELKDLEKLTRLSLQGNALSGQIPDALCSLDGLECLELNPGNAGLPQPPDCPLSHYKDMRYLTRGEVVAFLACLGASARGHC